MRKLGLVYTDLGGGGEGVELREEPQPASGDLKNPGFAAAQPEVS